MTVFRNPATVHAPLATYSHHAEVTAGRVLVMSGQIGMRPDGTMATDRFDQLRVAFENVRRNLEAADMEITDVVKLTIYLVGHWPPVERRLAVLDELGSHRPTMSVINVAGLGSDEMLVEIEVIAAPATNG